MEHAALETLALWLRDPMREERRAPVCAGRALSEVLGFRQRHLQRRPGTRPPWHLLLFGGTSPEVSRLGPSTRSRSHKVHSKAALSRPSPSRFPEQASTLRGAQVLHRFCRGGCASVAVTRELDGGHSLKTYVFERVERLAEVEVSLAKHSVLVNASGDVVEVHVPDMRRVRANHVSHGQVLRAEQVPDVEGHA